MMLSSIQQELIILSIPQKIKILKNCIDCLEKIYINEFKNNPPSDSSPKPSPAFMKFKSQVDKLKGQLQLPAQVANFIATGDGSKSAVNLVYQLNLFVQKIIDSDNYKLINGNRLNKATKFYGQNAQAYKEIEENINDLIVFIAELTAGIDIKFKYPTDKYCSILRLHAGTFTRQAGDFVTQAIKKESHAGQSLNTCTNLQAIKDSKQENNKKTVAALVASYSIINSNQLSSSHPNNRMSNPAWEVSKLPNVKLTIR